MFDNTMYNLYDGSRASINQSFLQDYTNKDIPTDIKELFRLVEYLAFNSGQVFSAMKKLTEFPITKPVFNTDDRSSKKLHEKISRIVKYKSASLEVGLDYNMYGNSCSSVYRPTIRYIICPNSNCKKKIRLKEADFKYRSDKDIFILNKCPSCESSGVAEIEDVKDVTLENINIIRWDIKLIDIEYNEFTGKRTYYYTMSESLRRKIKDNEIDTLCTYPRPMLALAGRDNKTRFKFSDGYIFHMKTPCLSGISNVWGFPPPTPALKSFFYQLMLRKANEAVALDYMNHLRVIYPAMSNPNNDPLRFINMSVWTDEMTQTLRKWRQDRNFVKLSPHPLGYQALGGEGRSLLLTNEIREAAYDILMTLGIPRELMEGSSAQNLGSPVVLRIVENMMLTFMEQMTEWINWVDKKISDWQEIESTEIDYVPFKFIDDISRKQLLIQWGQGGENKKVSDSTIAEHMDLDLDDEEDKIVEDSLRQYKLNKKIQKEIEDQETSLSQRAMQESQIAEGKQVDYNNQQQTMAQAEQVASELMGVPYEQRKSHLDALQKEDFVFYSVVKEMMEKVKHMQQRSVIDAAKTAEKIASLSGEYPKDYFKSSSISETELLNKLAMLENEIKELKNVRS